MSVQIANVNLAGAVVGQSGTVSWAQLLPPATIAQQMRPTQAGGSNISLFNESPCLLTVTLPVTGQTFTLPAGRWVAVALPPLEISLTWTVTAVAGTGLFNALLVDFFPAGETPHPIGTLGNSPIGGSVQVSASGSVVNYLVSPGVISGLVASKDVSIANQLDVTSGTAFVKPASGIITAVVPLPAHFLTSVHTATYFLDLNSDGTYSFGTSHSTDPNALALWIVTTDGSGNISTVSAVGNYNTIFLLNADSGQVQFGNGAAWVFPNGLTVLGSPIGAVAPITLLSGNQETGYMGISLSNVSASVGIGQSVNFKTIMTNVPSSITSTVDPSGSTNVGTGASIGNISIYGFNLFWVPTATGQSFWHGKYVTVGNCLLAVDELAGTFDHHCDSCGNIRRGLPIADHVEHAVLHSAEAGAYGLRISNCPVCGSSEHLHSGMSAADEADLAPQGQSTRGQQARFIRAIQRVLAVPMR